MTNSTKLQPNFFLQRPYLAVSLSHFFVDVLNSSRNLVVALIALDIGLTNAQLGIALLLYNVGGSLAQPLFGHWADRVGARWLVIGGVGWMITFFTIGALAGDWPGLIAFTLAGIGSGMFHPTGTMVASQISHTATGRATALFFFSGQFGLFIGPIFAGLLLDAAGRPGYVAAPAVAFLALVAAWRWLVDDPGEIHQKNNERDRMRGNSITRDALYWRRAGLLLVIILASSTVSISTITFAPKWFTELGYTQTRVGLLSGLLMLGSGLGGIVGGFLSDRAAGKWVIALGMAGLIAPIYFYIPAAGLLQPALLLVAGFFGGMPHTILVLMVQSLFPGRQALASGLALGLMFSGGALGSYLLGIVADSIGLGTALQMIAVLPVAAVLAATLLPRRAVHRSSTPA